MIDKQNGYTPEELKEKRLKLGLTQAERAAKLNTPYRTYQEWELGNRRIIGILTIAIKWIESQSFKILG